MTWQDWLFGTGGFFFAAALLPTIRNRAAHVPARTSVTTAVFLTAYVVAFASLGLWLSAVAGGASAAAWWTIAVIRRKPYRAEPVGRALEEMIEDFRAAAIYPPRQIVSPKPTSPKPRRGHWHLEPNGDGMADVFCPDGQPCKQGPGL